MSLTVSPCSERLVSVTGAEEYKLKSDEMWPEEVAHLFDNLEEGKTREGKISEGRKLLLLTIS